MTYQDRLGTNANETALNRGDGWRFVSHVRACSFEDVIDREQEWIDETELQGVGGIRLGVPKLREVLSATLVERIVGELPMIISQLDTKVNGCETKRPYVSDFLSVNNEDHLLRQARDKQAGTSKRSSLSHSKKEGLCCFAQIEEVRHNQGFLQQLASQKDMTSLAHELEGLVNLLHPAVRQANATTN
jgi:hypothetical protein|eukprot:COSAG06_NODE_12656_length_1346_cov_19.090657_1_plen_188_part_10